MKDIWVLHSHVSRCRLLLQSNFHTLSLELCVNTVAASEVADELPLASRKSVHLSVPPNRREPHRTFLKFGVQIATKEKAENTMNGRLPKGNTQSAISTIFLTRVGQPSQIGFIKVFAMFLLHGGRYSKRWTVKKARDMNHHPPPSTHQLVSIAVQMGAKAATCFGSHGSSFDAMAGALAVLPYRMFATLLGSLSGGQSSRSSCVVVGSTTTDGTSNAPTFHAPSPAHPR